MTEQTRTDGSRSRLLVVATLPLTMILLAQLSLGTAANAGAEKPANPSSAAEQRFPAFRGMQDSRDISAPVLMHGRLTDPEGNPLADADVLLAAEPSRAFIEAMPIGASYSLLPVARTTTDSNGDYAMRAPFSALMRSRHGVDGIDLELDIFVGNRHLVYFSQAKFDEPSSTWTLPVVASLNSDDPASRPKPTRGHHPLNQLDLTLDPITGGSEVPADAVVPNEEEPVARHHQGLTCSDWVLISTQDPRETVSTAIVRWGATLTATYKGTKSTTSGMGYRVAPSGQWAGVSWSQSGTKEVTNTFEGNFGSSTAGASETLNREFRVNMIHRTYNRHCWIGCSVCQHSWEAQEKTSPGLPSGGGGNFNSRYADWACHTTVTWNGPGVSTTTATAATYTSAFSVSAIGGGVSFQGTARSGYNSNIKITFTFKSPPGRWCGDSGYPTEAKRVKGWY
jgi:hypothetical protein